MKHLQKIGYIALGAVLSLTAVTAAPALADAAAEFFTNSVNVALNGTQVAAEGENYILADGTQVPYSITYKGTTYLPIRKVGELVGKEIYWDKDTRTAGVGTPTTTPAHLLDNADKEIALTETTNNPDYEKFAAQVKVYKWAENRDNVVYHVLIQSGSDIDFFKNLSTESCESIAKQIYSDLGGTTSKFESLQIRCGIQSDKFYNGIDTERRLFVAGHHLQDNKPEWFFYTYDSEL